jgi:hypothetical protein
MELTVNLIGQRRFPANRAPAHSATELTEQQQNDHHTSTSQLGRPRHHVY